MPKLDSCQVSQSRQEAMNLDRHVNPKQRKSKQNNPKKLWLSGNGAETFMARLNANDKLACLTLYSHSKISQEILVSPPAMVGLLRRRGQDAIEPE